MKRDSKLSGILHVLLHMSSLDTPVTSEKLAAMMSTNPVVVRRIMAGLRERGLVHSEKGHGGGWTITRDLETVTMADVYAAVGAPEVFALGNRSEQPSCLVEQAVNAALDDAFAEAEALLMSRFAGVTLGALAADFRQRLKARHQSLEEQHHDL
ncbi:Putative HTH-type transcriptional regulator YwnA [Asticcacaulis sp. MM231]|uniref:Rrf2 family transcriptional regulator n=1 Tax=Asticcacaulis sp. MM231 TaxID=3157666 RepID=UPI0032D56B58